MARARTQVAGNLKSPLALSTYVVSVYGLVGRQFQVWYAYSTYVYIHYIYCIKMQLFYEYSNRLPDP